MADLPDTNDPHALLGVPADATAEEVRRAYLRRIKVFKPDRDPVAFRRLRAAYETLSQRIAMLEQLGGTGEVIGPGWDQDAEPEEEPTRPAARRDRLRELARQITAALGAHRRDEAARLLLTPEAELLATEPAFGRSLLDVCCATVWSTPALTDALRERYPDVLAAAESMDDALSSHPYWDLLSLGLEHPAWAAATSKLPELTAFLELGTVVDGPARRDLGAALAQRVAADPVRALEMLDAAVGDAPGVVDLLRERAETWADTHAGDGAVGSDSSAPTAVAMARQLEAELSRTGRVRMEWLKRLAVTASPPLLVVATGGSLPVLIASALLGSLTYHLAFDATRSLYRELVRPAVVPWLVATGQPTDLVAEQLRRQLEARGPTFGLLRPDQPKRYPELLAKDTALGAFAALARLLRAADLPRSEPTN